MHIVNGLLLITVFILGIISVNKYSVTDVSPTDFLPQDTLIYVEQRSGSQAIQKFQKSRIGKSLVSIDFPDVLMEMDVNQAYIALTEKTLSTISRLKDDPLIHAILGKQCSLALFARREWLQDAASVTEYLEEHLLLISEPEVNKDIFDTLVSTYTDGVMVTHIPYGKYSITRFTLNEKILSVAYSNGLILASLEERIVREALDVYDQKNDSLEKLEDFKHLTEKLNGADQKIYLAVEGLQDLIEYGANNASTPWGQQLISEFSSLKGVSAVFYGAWQNQKILKNRFFVRLNRDNMNNLVKEMVNTTPSINYSLPFVSRDALFYYWSNTLNARLLWDMYTSEAGDDTFGTDLIEDTIFEISNYSLEDIIEMVSSNVGILVKKNERDKFVPIPDLALLVKLKDSLRIQDVISTSLENLDIKVQSRTYKGIKYYYWGIYPQESLQPVYAIHREYLIFANTLDILKAIIDTPVKDTRLIEDSEFKELDPGFQVLNNSVCYIDQTNLLSHLREFISWAGTILAIQDRQAAEKSKFLIENLINPLFYGMGMYEKTATRTYMQGDLIIIESQTRILQ